MIGLANVKDTTNNIFVKKKMELTYGCHVFTFCFQIYLNCY